MIDGHWLSTHRADPRAYALYRRHYSASIKGNHLHRRRGNANIVGPGSPMVLLTQAIDALFVWLKNSTPRFDGQAGICCTVFRNEGPVLSSELIREADALADRKWPYERHFTYIDATATAARRSRNAQPGHCFLKAGWRICGRSKDGLILLERP